MSFSDTFYIALCMTVLLIGVVYWFWTQNQYLQRKLNTLETIVYEMRSTFNSAVSAPDAILDSTLSSAVPKIATTYAPPPSDNEEADDVVFHDELMATEAQGHIAEFEDLDTTSNNTSTTATAFSSAPIATESLTVADLANWEESPLLSSEGGSESDLQPGGGAGIKEFVQPDTESSGNVLDGMTLKELRRLAEQKNIANAKAMKKHELIAAIRTVASARPINVMEATLSLQ